jgi:hypothetical protein
MIDFKSFREKLLADPEVVKEYETHKAEFDTLRAIIKKRIASQTQKKGPAKAPLQPQE